MEDTIHHKTGILQNRHLPRNGALANAQHATVQTIKRVVKWNLNMILLRRVQPELARRVMHFIKILFPKSRPLAQTNESIVGASNHNRPQYESEDCLYEPMHTNTVERTEFFKLWIIRPGCLLAFAR